MTGVQTCALPIWISSDEFLYTQRKNKVLQQILQVVNAEAPLSRDQLCRKVLSAWEISRMGTKVDEYFRILLLELKLESTISGANHFFWKKGQLPSEYLNYRISDKNADDISAEEISVAVKEILEQQISLSKGDLMKETARLFGFGRLGTIVEAAMLRGIEMAIKRGFAKKVKDRIAVNE